MSKMQFSFLWAGVISFILWFASVFISLTLPVAVLFLAAIGAAGVYGGTIYPKPASGTMTAQGYVKGGAKGKGWEVNWGWQDWGGLILLILVIVALLKGANPIDLIKYIGAIFGSKQ